MSIMYLTISHVIKYIQKYKQFAFASFVPEIGKILNVIIQTFKLIYEYIERAHKILATI